jgi:5-methyltetrahydrofolate--homocysteine methyltransferase
MNDFVTVLSSGFVLVMDGAMGTELLRLTRSACLECGEAYNLGQGDIVRSIHHSYLDAGADVLLTNTFQANPAALSRRGLEDRHHDIWEAAIRLARLNHERPHFILADIGPIENCTVAIAAKILSECVNVDGVLLETWSSLDALKRFVDRRSSASLPLLVSFTFHRTKDYLTFKGIRPEHCAREARRYGAVAIGANCGKEIGMPDILEIVKRYRNACDLPIFVRPNAGSPTKKGWRFPRTPQTMAAALPTLLEAGIAMVGGCCGTTPQHIQQFRAVVDEWNRAKGNRPL